MTLILSCATREYVVQVSDRRLMLPNGDLYDDNTNKMVFFNQIMSFGYTGLAQLSTRRSEEAKTDWWLTNALSMASPSSSLSDTILYLRDQATVTFRRITFSKANKHLSIVGIGWGSLSPQPSLVPIVCVVTNCQDEHGKWFAEACDEFRLYAYALAESSRTKSLFYAHGQELLPQVLCR